MSRAFVNEDSGGPPPPRLERALGGAEPGELVDLADLAAGGRVVPVEPPAVGPL